MKPVTLDADVDRSFSRLIDPENGQSPAANFMQPRPSVKERLQAGKALRQRVPRADHAIYKARPDRADTVGILERQNATRAKKLVPLRYARMLASPFAFLRGSAAVMAADLAATPVTRLAVNACGDMHVANFGVFASAERRLVFAINDFDEAHPGPWEWDLKRLATSAAVAVRFAGGEKVDARNAAQAVSRTYRTQMKRYAEMGHLETWYSSIDEQAILDTLSPKVRRRAERTMDKARAKGHMQVLDKLTEKVGDQHLIVEDVPLIVRETHLSTGLPIGEALDAMLKSYVESLTYDRRRLLARYRIVDVARKVVGVGSVGTGCWIVLLQGIDSDDPLFLQVKEAQPSVLSPYVDFRLPFDNQGRRVVVGQRLIQGSPDIFLGWGEVEGRHFYVRQLADMKGSVKFTEGGRGAAGLTTEYHEICGWALALAHAKGGDAAMIAGYCGNSEELDEAIGTFALAYAQQTEHDHESLDKARRDGRIEVATDDVVK